MTSQQLQPTLMEEAARAAYIRANSNLPNVHACCRSAFLAGAKYAAQLVDSGRASSLCVFTSSIKAQAEVDGKHGL